MDHGRVSSRNNFDLHRPPINVTKSGDWLSLSVRDRNASLCSSSVQLPSSLTDAASHAEVAMLMWIGALFGEEGSAE